MNPIDSLKEQARVWAAKVVELHNTPVPPALEQDKRKLLNFAKTVKNAIEKVFPSFSDIADLDQQLDFLPIVFGGAIAIAAAAITKWTYDYNRFKTRVAEFRRLEPIVGADQARKIVGPFEPTKASLINLGSGPLIPIAVLGVGAYFLLRKR